MLAFCQRLVQTPSLSGEEGDVAALIRTEMERLGYDEVWSDDWGNIVARWVQLRSWRAFRFAIGG